MEQLRQQCLEEKVDKHADAVKAYSALTQAPKEWTLEVHDMLPCSHTNTILLQNSAQAYHACDSCTCALHTSSHISRIDIHKLAVNAHTDIIPLCCKRLPDMQSH